MRFSVSLLALLVASPVLAEDFLVRADVAEAVVYSGVAEVLRRVDIDLEAGTHRIMFPSNTIWSGHPPLVSVGDGVILGEIAPMENVNLEDGALDSAAQAAARLALEGATDAVIDTETEIQAAQGALRAAQLQQTYLLAIVEGGDDGIAMPSDPEAIGAFMAGLGAEMVRAHEAVHSAEQTLRDLRGDLEDRVADRDAAARALQDLQPLAVVQNLWSVTVELTESGPLNMEVTEATDAHWAPSYEAYLDSESGALRLERQIRLSTEGLMPWQDVEVTLSTSDPYRSLGNSGVWPSRARIHETIPAQPRGGLMSMESEAVAAADQILAQPMIEPVVIVEDSIASMFVDGLSLTYELSDPVTIGPSGGAYLPFGSVELQADLINRAVPRQDATAYLIADIENTTREPILPGVARFFRDGALIGDGDIGFIAEGVEAELPFGPLDHIQLSWTDLSRDTGDRGVFVSSDTEERRVMVTAQNLSGEPVELELLYATPFSEQEDLEIEVSTTLSPDDTAWEDRRGVYAWELSLDPGQEMQIRMDFAFSWPDGQILDWRP